jgi:hypothetical protein
MRTNKCAEDCTLPSSRIWAEGPPELLVPLLPVSVEEAEGESGESASSMLSAWLNSLSSRLMASSLGSTCTKTML